MKRSKFLKTLFLILLVSLVAIFMSGCVVIVSPVVQISIGNDNWTYRIYVDGTLYGTTDFDGELTLYTVSPGYHFFEAEDTSFFNRYGSKWQTITSGFNQVTIFTS